MRHIKHPQNIHIVLLPNLNLYIRDIVVQTLGQGHSGRWGEKRIDQLQLRCQLQITDIVICEQFPYNFGTDMRGYRSKSDRGGWGRRIYNFGIF